MDKRWIDGILWSCLAVMFLSVLALLWSQALSAHPQEWGPVAKALAQP